MQRCPFCEHELPYANVDEGTCGACGRDLGAVTDTFVMDDADIDLWAQLEIPSGMADDAGVESDKDRVTTPAAAVKAHVLRREDDAAAGGPTADFLLEEVLGQGGMGVVYQARQTSVDRRIAIKMMKPDHAASAKIRKKFIAEATVTGDLDHPNIVPIYTLGSDTDGVLFYAMKHVQGVSWKAVMHDRELRDNIDILMRVSDAVAFAHSRGVIHRDLKAENVMLGEFGEVLVMDWGMAVAVAAHGKAENLSAAASIGGTPAYMPPEMAMGDTSRIGITSDVYLLGAILYEIVCGHPPHEGNTVSEYLSAAVRNEIRPARPRGDKADELVDIALQAMATDIEDRFESVKSFQNAIRDYLAHSESIARSLLAGRDLDQALHSRDYDEFARALFGFQEALLLWSDNTAAAAGEVVAREKYASCAFAKGDLDLAESLLVDDEPDHARLCGKIQETRTLRRRQRARHRIVVRTVRLLIAVVIITLSVAFIWIRREKQQVEDARRLAEKALAAEAYHRTKAENEKERAVAAEKLALIETDKALAAQRAEMRQRELAETQRQIAERQRRIAEHERVRAEEAAARAITAQNAENVQREKAQVATQAAAEARSSLTEQNLKMLSAQAHASKVQRQSVEAKYAASLLLIQNRINEGRWSEASALLQSCPAVLRNWEWGRLQALCRPARRRIGYAGGAVSFLQFSDDGNELIVAGGAGIGVWRVRQNRLLYRASCHPEGVVAAGFHIADDRIVTVSSEGKMSLRRRSDGAALLQSAQEGIAVVTATALAAGSEFALVGYADGTAVMRHGRTQARVTAFVGQTDVIRSLATRDGTLVAAGGSRGSIRLWRCEEAVQTFDFAFDKDLLGTPASAPGEYTDAARRRDLSNPLLSSLVGVGSIQVSFPERADASEQVAVFTGHSDAVTALAFTADKRRLLSASADGTARIWNVPAGINVLTFGGHGAAISAATVVPEGDVAVTGDAIGDVLMWRMANGTEVVALRPAHDGRVAAIAVAPSGRLVATGGDDGQTLLWDLDDSEHVTRIRAAGERITATCFLRGSRRLVTGAASGEVRLWDAETGDILEHPGTADGGIDYIGLSADETMIVTVATTQSVDVWDARKGGRLCRLRDFSGLDATVELPAAIRSALVQHLDHILLAARPRAAVSPSTDAAGGFGPEYTGDGRYALIGYADGSVSMWDAINSSELYNIGGKDDGILSAAFSPDGRRFVTAGGDGAVVLWSTATGLELITLGRHERRVSHVAFAADGIGVVTCERSGLCHVWHADDWRGSEEDTLE